MGTSAEATPRARQEGTLHPEDSLHLLRGVGRGGRFAVQQDAPSQVPLPSLQLLTGMWLAVEELQCWQESIFLPFPSALKQSQTRLKAAKTNRRNQNKSGSFISHRKFT